MDNNEKLIENVLQTGANDIAFEELPGENSSPLAQPVIDKNNPSADARASQNATQNAADSSSSATGQQQVKEEKKENQTGAGKKEATPSDAPEQPIDAKAETDNSGSPGAAPAAEEPKIEIPLSHATTMADTLLGMANNTIFEVGAGYFVTIQKSKEFYEFDELIQIIDEQNHRNIKRVKLDEEDKALLRPLLIAMIREKAKVLTPMQQMVGVIISIIIKKAKVVMEIRAENEMLEERLRDIIRNERPAPREQERETETESKVNEPTAQSRGNQEQNSNTQQNNGHQDVEFEEIPNSRNSNTGLPSEVLETAA